MPSISTFKHDQFHRGASVVLASTEADGCLMLAVLDNLQQRGHITVPNFNKSCASGSLHPCIQSFSGHGTGVPTSANVAGILETTKKVAKTIGELSLPAVKRNTQHLVSSNCSHSSNTKMERLK